MPARGRKRKIRYWATRKGGGYFTTINGRQIELALGPDDKDDKWENHGPTFTKAWKKWMSLQGLETDKGTDEYLVSALLNQYRLHLHSTRESAAPGIFDSMARGFSDRFGQEHCSALIAGEVQKWLDAQENWNPTSKRHAGALILAAFRWARRKGFIQTDPLAGRLDLPTQVVRGRDARMPPDLCALLVEEAKKGRDRTGAFSFFLRVLWETGARPMELRRAEAFNVSRGRITFRWNATRGYRHKTAKKTQRDRVIMLTEESAQRLQQLAEQYPEGPIFRSPKGLVWGSDTLSSRWIWVCSRPAVLECAASHGYSQVDRWLPHGRVKAADLRMYNFRHTFASEYLDATGDIWTLARLLGNSVGVIERRYGHPDEELIMDAFRSYHRSK